MERFFSEGINIHAEVRHCMKVTIETDNLFFSLLRVVADKSKLLVPFLVVDINSFLNFFNVIEGIVYCVPKSVSKI